MNEEGLRVRCSRLWAICSDLEISLRCGHIPAGQDDPHERKKQKYVLYYKNVVSTRQGLIGDFYIFCREPILLYGKQQGPTMLIEYYRKQDIYQIKRIIGNGNYNVY